HRGTAFEVYGHLASLENGKDNRGDGPWSPNPMQPQGPSLAVSSCDRLRHARDDRSEGAMDLIITGARDEKTAIAVAGALDRNFHVALAHKAGEFFAPLDQENGIARDEVVEAEGFELARRVHAVEINVIDVHSGTAIFVHQSKGGAGHVLLRGGVESFGDAFDESSFAGTKIAAQKNQTRWSEGLREFAAESYGFFGGVRGEFFRRHA